ncbi:MAG TPA: hypothetical protein VL405_02250 [Sphingomonas sp.]|jgi:hypothetical protein|nr:hypothetical protein [Sphingomonas sp.]
MTSLSATPARAALWLNIIAALGAAWNIFGLTQWVDFAFRTRSSLTMRGMSAAAADLYYGLPLWMTIAFAVGSGGGLIGCVGLILRRRWAVPVLAVSLGGYIALFVGDAMHGVFAAIPGQMAILSTVVAFAVGLLAVGLFAQRRALLRSRI